jgi:hypothetical protein
MRSPAQASEALLARLFTDSEFRERFKQDPRGSGREIGLDDAALATLEQIDWVGLELAANSYRHKRDSHARRRRRWWSFLRPAS